MLVIPTELRPSLIHGIGLFTLKPIAKDTMIAKWVPGFDLTVDVGWWVAAMQVVAADFVHHYGYLDKKDLVWRIPFDNLRFINHSDTPNTHAINEDDYASRDIAAGEELTCDYFTFDLGAEQKLGRSR